MIFWVKYGFENTPVKMYNANVSSAILLSFVRTTCAREIEDYCKHKHIQLGIELDALHKELQQTRQRLARADTLTSASTESLASVTAAAPTVRTTSRPPSGASRPTTPAATRASAKRGSAAAAAAPAAVAPDEPNEEVAAALAQIDALEKQLAVVDSAMQCARELAAGLLHVDFADKSGAPLHLDDAGAAKASTRVTLREHYSVIAIRNDATGERCVTPLVFKLQG